LVAGQDSRTSDAQELELPTVAAIALGVVACSSGPTQPPIGAWVNLYALLEFMPVGEVGKGHRNPGAARCAIGEGQMDPIGMGESKPAGDGQQTWVRLRPAILLGLASGLGYGILTRFITETERFGPVF